MTDRPISLTEHEYADLKASGGRFRDLVNSTDGIVWEADAQTFTFTFVSEQATRLLGFSTSDWYQPGFWVNRLHPEDKAWAPEYCASCTHRLEPHDFEYRFIAKDGRIVWLRDIVSVVSENGQPRWLRGVMVDITEQKQLEAELVRTHKLLEKAQKLANLGGWSVERATGEVHWTREVYRIHRVPPEFDATGLTRDINFYVPEHRPIISRALKLAMETAEPFDLELKLMRTDHQTVWVRVIGDPEFEDGEVVRIVGNVMDITERKLTEEKIQAAAYIDPLTELPNRRFFLERLDSARASCSRLNLKGALLFIDLDNFKKINDEFGHDKGDLVLKDVGNSLKSCIREDDTVARLGGDEFVVMLEFINRPDVQVIESARSVAEKIILSLKQNSSMAVQNYQVTPSIGIALFDGDSDMQETLRRADLAMYQAKANGRNSISFYDSENLQT